MKKILIGLGALVVLLVIVVLALPMFIPASVLEERIERAASEALGREVTIDGAPKISILPTEATVKGLTVANAEGFSAPHLAQVEEADIGVKLMPLLSKRIEITRFHLKNPDIRLEATEEGTNWALGAPGEEPAPAEETGGGPVSLPDVHLGDVRLTGGRVTYQGPDGKLWEARDADLVLTLDSLDDPLGLKGDMVVQGEPSKVDARFSTPRSYAEQGSATMDLDMTVGDNNAAMDLSLTDELAFDGNLDIDFPALRSLFALVGADLGTENGFNRLRLDGPVSGTTSRIAFGQGTELEFDEIKGTGAIAIDVSGARPSITGDMTLGTLDLTPYLPAADPEFEAAKQDKSSAFPAWSTEPMDLSALGAVDADLDIQTGEVILPGITIGDTALSLLANAGDVTVDVKDTSLYGGKGKGTLTAKAVSTPQVGVNFALLGVDAGQAAKELAGITRLRGTGDITLNNVTVTGASQAAMVKSLAGQINLDLKDGAIEGINIGKIGRSALQAYDTLTGEGGGLNTANLVSSLNGVITEARGPSQESDFSDFNLALDANGGVVRSRSIRLEGPYYEITGDAAVDLPNQAMEMSLIPAIAAEGSDLRRKLPVPITVGGSFNSPSVGIDMQSVISGAVNNRVGKLLKDQGVNVTDGENLQDTLRNTARDELTRALSGKKDEEDAAEGDDASDTDGETSTEQPDPRDELIRQGIGALLGGSKSEEEPKQEDDGGNE